MDERSYLERRKADRREAVSQSVAGYEACRRQEERRIAKRRDVDSARVYHWIEVFQWHQRRLEAERAAKKAA